jgi:hypothetical protein
MNGGISSPLFLCIHYFMECLDGLSSSVVDAWIYPSSLKADMTPNYAGLIFYKIKNIIKEYNFLNYSLYQTQ